MSGKHTPGPWVIIPARPYDGDDEALAGSFEAFAGIEGADGSPVCVFGDASGSATMFENEADYSLIAAAPELLEAMKEFFAAKDWAREGGFNHEEAYRFLCKGGRGMDAQNAMLAAIAKATGEQA